MKYYCTISRCSNLSANPIFNPNYVSVSCRVFTSPITLASFLDGFHYHLTPDTTKEEYIRTVVATEIMDEPLRFKSLSMNSSCCELYLYITSDSSRIVYDEENNRSYVLMTPDQDKNLWSM